MRLMIGRLRKDGQGAQGHRPADRLFALPVRMGCGVGVGTGGWAPTCGAPRATFSPTGRAFTRSSTSRQGLAKYAGPGHWNDPDMLEVGNGKLIAGENRAHFSMWAMLAAPLLAGNDLPNMKPEIKAILTNRDVIAIDQDKLGHEATRAYSDGEVDVWTRHLSGGAMAVAVLNAGSRPVLPTTPSI